LITLNHTQGTKDRSQKSAACYLNESRSSAWRQNPSNPAYENSFDQQWPNRLGSLIAQIPERVRNWNLDRTTTCQKSGHRTDRTRDRQKTCQQRRHGSPRPSHINTIRIYGKRHGICLLHFLFTMSKNPELCRQSSDIKTNNVFWYLTSGTW